VVGGGARRGEREREEGGEKAWEMGNGKGGGNAFFLHRYLGEKMREPVLSMSVCSILSRVWFFNSKIFIFKAYLLLAPKCRVGASKK
jgi:hypothetical protein